jgi:hypothetical protein
MRSLTRQCAVVVLASSLALGFPAPVAAAATAGAPLTVAVTRIDPCPKLAEALAFLTVDVRLPSPLRAFLVRVTQGLQTHFGC